MKCVEFSLLPSTVQVQYIKTKKSSAQNNGRSPVMDRLESLSDRLKSFTKDH